MNLQFLVSISTVMLFITQKRETDIFWLQIEQLQKCCYFVVGIDQIFHVKNKKFISTEKSGELWM